MKRLSTIKSVASLCLFDEIHATEDSVKNKSQDISDQEISVLLKLVVFIKPYIPSKNNYMSIPHPPFCLMENHVLQTVGYPEKAVNLVPLTMPSKLYSLALDASTLFFIFVSAGTLKRLDIKNFDGGYITSEQDARSRKDAVFPSFFNIDTLISTAAAYGLQFMHRIHILPGLKTIRLYGTRKESKQMAVDKQKEKKTERWPQDQSQRLVLQGEVDNAKKYLMLFISNTENNVRKLRKLWSQG
ncbi:hypothetical protein [Parasitella parasitica]|uniref:Uncharacterized protein n=1 Tax=Parasitella parasitica TaxID=35722 RepID=A0A0B7NCX4_9FUNG|nr:hypothetical protein [Parasitella parasitica]